jgi:hypothetical protein
MNLSIRNCFPLIYNTRYSYVFSLYGILVKLRELKSEIVVGGKKKQVSVSDSPHYLCAIECLHNTETLKLMLGYDKSRLIGYISANNLIYTKKYLNYLENAHPETDALETLVGFLALMNIVSTESYADKSKISVLVQRRKGINGSRFWLLIDGLHRSSILLAKNKVKVNARVRFRGLI